MAANSPRPRPAHDSRHQASVIVDGQTVNGMTLPTGTEVHGTRFRRRRDAIGARSGAQVWLRYERPGTMGMMGKSGVVMLYDDGTHGDHAPGDGLYCLYDERDADGCHGSGAPMGDYHYEFWGSHSQGESNHMRVTVTVAGS
jgi:hypothetical protein